MHLPNTPVRCVYGFLHNRNLHACMHEVGMWWPLLLLLLQQHITTIITSHCAASLPASQVGEG